MQDIKEIIELLSSAEGSLESALLKTKVLLHDLGESQSQKWINNELTGYSDDDNNVPDYRLINLEVWGDVNDIRVHITELPSRCLSTSCLDKELKNNLTRVYFRRSIGSIEESKKDKIKGSSLLEIGEQLSPELYSCLSEPLKASSYKVKKAWTAIPHIEVSQIINRVRPKLLDFVLALSEKLPSDMGNQQNNPVLKSSDINKMFTNAMFGDNVTITIGDNNVSKIQNIVTKNNMESLEKVLRENKVAPSDIDSLKEALAKDKDAPELKQRSFGSHVSTWLGNMTAKTVSKTVDIGVIVILTQAIKGFLGF